MWVTAYVKRGVLLPPAGDASGGGCLRRAGRRVEPLAVRAPASLRLASETMKRLDLNLLRCNRSMGGQLLHFVRADAYRRVMAGAASLPFSPARSGTYSPRRAPPCTCELLKKLNQNFNTVWSKHKRTAFIFRPRRRLLQGYGGSRKCAVLSGAKRNLFALQGAALHL